MKTFELKRHGDQPGQTMVVVTEPGHGDRALRHLVRHSPTGLEWGYGGSGPADLARSIVGEVLGDPDPSPVMYQRVKEQLIATLPSEGGIVTEEEVREVLGIPPYMEQAGTDPILLESLEHQCDQIGQTIKSVMPDDVGFTLMMFTLGEGGWMTYVSSAQRDDVIKAMREFILKATGQGDLYDRLVWIKNHEWSSESDRLEALNEVLEQIS